MYIKASEINRILTDKRNMRMASLLKIEELVESISKEQTGKVTLTAKWEAEGTDTPVEGNVLEVGEGKTYATLEDALAAAQDGDTIKLYAGEYTLSSVIAKSVKIVGPKANTEPRASQEAEALIKEVNFEKYHFVLKLHPLSSITIDDQRVINDHIFSSLEFFHKADIIIHLLHITHT